VSYVIQAFAAGMSGVALAPGGRGSVDYRSLNDRAAVALDGTLSLSAIAAGDLVDRIVHAAGGQEGKNLISLLPNCVATVVAVLSHLLQVGRAVTMDQAINTALGLLGCRDLLRQYAEDERVSEGEERVRIVDDAKRDGAREVATDHTRTREFSAPRVLESVR